MGNYAKELRLLRKNPTGASLKIPLLHMDDSAHRRIRQGNRQRKLAEADGAAKMGK